MSKLNTQYDVVERAAMEVENALQSGETFASKIPSSLSEKLAKWKFGGYGWTSPVNLIITAAWVKWLNPEQDVCKIWAKDSRGKPITGAYSIRTLDESITVPVVNKLNISDGFCSSNSGMQGTRAIEKARGSGRLDRNVTIEQKVLFDLTLFVNIMNDISALNSAQAKCLFQALLEKGLSIKNSRSGERSSVLMMSELHTGDGLGMVLRASTCISDPQFVRAVTAAALHFFIKGSRALSEAIICGIEGHMTGADARSGNPGDLWLELEGTPVIGCEVKDKSKTFDFTMLRAAESRIANNTSIKTYFMVSAAPIAAREQILLDTHWQHEVEARRRGGTKIIPITLRDLLLLSATFSQLDSDIVQVVTNFLVATPGLKVETLKHWERIIS